MEHDRTCDSSNLQFHSDCPVVSITHTIVGNWGYSYYLRLTQSKVALLWYPQEDAS